MLSPDSRKVIERCLNSEIEAFKRTLEATGKQTDYWGDPKRDVREDYLKLLLKALDEVKRA